MPFPAFLDTCALYGATLTDTLLRIAEQDAFRPMRSPDVLRSFAATSTRSRGSLKARPTAGSGP